jgi:hypothetical protein
VLIKFFRGFPSLTVPVCSDTLPTRCASNAFCPCTRASGEFPGHARNLRPPRDCSPILLDQTRSIGGRIPSRKANKRTPKTVLRLPDLEQSKSAVMNSLTSASSKRSYDHAIREFIDWYCSEPRGAFNRTVVTRYRIAVEQHPYAPSTINLRLAAIRRLAYEASDCGLLSLANCGKFLSAM